MYSEQSTPFFSPFRGESFQAFSIPAQQVQKNMSRVFAAPPELRVKEMSERIRTRVFELFPAHEDIDCLNRAISSLTDLYRQLSDQTSAVDAILKQIEALDSEHPFSKSAYKVANLIAWLVQKEVEMAPHQLFGRKGVGVLLEQQKFESGWLEDLLPEQLPLCSADRIYKFIADLSNDHCSQNTRLLVKKALDGCFTLSLVNSEECPLTKAQRISLCLFAAMTKTAESRLCKKSCYKLPVSLQYGTERIYFLFKNKIKVETDKSSYKKVTVGMYVPLRRDREVEFVAQAVNRHETAYAVEKMNREAAYHQMLHQSAKSGIWPIWDVCTYEKQRGEKSVPKISIVMPWGYGLYKLFQENVSLPVALVQSVIKQLCTGLVTIHQAGLIHGDIKSNNALFSWINDKEVEVGFIDFGFCFKVESHDTRPSIFKAGWYGSVTPTAPELLGEPHFRGDYQKAEIWAFGFMLFESVFGRYPKWNSILLKYHKVIEDADRGDYFMVDPKDESKIKELIEEEIEQPRRALLKIKDHNPFEKLCLFIYDLMRINPNERLDAQTALERVCKIW